MHLQTDPIPVPSLFIQSQDLDNYVVSIYTDISRGISLSYTSDEKLQKVRSFINREEEKKGWQGKGNI